MYLGKTYKLWFSFEENSQAARISFYYPAGRIHSGQQIRIISWDHWRNVKWSNKWVHGNCGLCKDVLFHDMTDFMNRIEDGFGGPPPTE
jgi:hypothetical protein